MTDAVLGKLLLGALTGGAGGAGGAGGGAGGGFGGPRGPSYCFLEQNNGFCGREGCTWMHKGGHFPGKRFADAEVQEFLCKELKGGEAVKKVGKLLKSAETDSSSSDSESEKELRELIKNEEAKKMKKEKLKKQLMKIKAEKLEKKKKKSMKSHKKLVSEEEESESEADAAKAKQEKLKKKLKQKIKLKEQERADAKKTMKKLTKALQKTSVDSTPANSDSDSDDDVPLGGRGKPNTKKKKEKKEVAVEEGTSKKKQASKPEGKLTKYVKSGFSPAMKKLKTKGTKRRLFESELESDANEMKTDDVFPHRREKLTKTESETPAKSLGGLNMDEVCEYVSDYIQARTGAANTVFDETTDEKLLHPVMMQKATKMLKKLADDFQVKSIGRKTHTTMLKDPSMQTLVLTRVKEDWGDRGDGLGVFHNIVFNAADQIAHVVNQKDLLMAASERLGLRKFDKDPEKMVVLIGVLTTCFKMDELDEEKAKANNEKKKTNVVQLSSSSSSSASSDSDEDDLDSDEETEQDTDNDEGEEKKKKEAW